MIVLVDSGASHNFLSCDLVEVLGIQPEETREYAVKVGDRHRIVNKGVCRGVELKLPTLDVKQDFYLFELGGVDVVLGYEWLEGLGNIEINFKEHVMRVKVKGEEVELRGDPSLSQTVASLEAMMKEWKRGNEAYYIELGMMTLCSEDTPIYEQGGGIEALLEEYAELFQEAVQLPPPRSCDHAIVIKEGSQIPNIRSYRYPHNQKDAIEKFVQDMLAAGLIRPSVSPCSSPLILVKKKKMEVGGFVQIIGPLITLLSH